MCQYSFAVIADDWERALYTVRSILQIPQWQSCAELFLIEAAGTAPPEELIRLKMLYPKQICVLEGEKPLDSLCRLASGEYITLPFGGASYSPDMIRSLNAFLEQPETEDIRQAIAVTGKAEKAGYEWKQFTRLLNRARQTMGVSLYEAVPFPYTVTGGFFVKTSLLQGAAADFENPFLGASMLLLQALAGTEGFGLLEEPLFFDADGGGRHYMRQMITECAGNSGDLNRLLNVLEGVMAQPREGLHQTVFYYCSAMMNPDIALLAYESGEAREVFAARLLKILYGLSDTMIMNSGLLPPYMKRYIMEQKYGGSSRSVCFHHERYYYAGGVRLATAGGAHTLLQFIEIDEARALLTIEGTTRFPCCCGGAELYFEVNGTRMQCENLNYDMGIRWMGRCVYDGMAFRFRLPLDGKTEQYTLQLWMLDGGYWVKKSGIHVGKFAPVSDIYSESYYTCGCWTLKKTDGGVTLHNDAFRRPNYELAFLRQLLQKNGRAALKPLLARTAIRLLAPFFRRKVWLIQDRINRADDNGEAFFLYLCRNRDKIDGITPVFVIEKGTPEARRLRRFGRVVSPRSWAHRWNFLKCEFVISSQANPPVVAPFAKTADYYRDILCGKRFIFLQHGVTKDNQSRWLNRFNRDIHGLVVSTRAEYNSMLQYEYFYEPSRIWLTGMPRYDLLYHEERRYVTIMPTWRKSLMRGADPKTGIWLLKDGFASSAYYRFYRGLLENETLLAAAERLGYTVCYMPHPNMAPYTHELCRDVRVNVFDTDKPYREIFAETDLLVTDYSSVAFDFAYLNKPVLYTQFDYKEFFSGAHSYTEGYFDYERDGFGEVTHTLEETVSRIVAYMENGCRMEPKYHQRIMNTFAFQDTQCCARVLERLLALSGGDRREAGERDEI